LLSVFARAPFIIAGQRPLYYVANPRAASGSEPLRTGRERRRRSRRKPRVIKLKVRLNNHHLQCCFRTMEKWLLKNVWIVVDDH
jgi:hypothetical protein